MLTVTVKHASFKSLVLTMPVAAVSARRHGESACHLSQKSLQNGQFFENGRSAVG